METVFFSQGLKILNSLSDVMRLYQRCRARGSGAAARCSSPRSKRQTHSFRNMLVVAHQFPLRPRFSRRSLCSDCPYLARQRRTVKTNQQNRRQEQEYPYIGLSRAEIIAAPDCSLFANAEGSEIFDESAVADICPERPGAPEG
jgi:hypothetical protein